MKKKYKIFFSYLLLLLFVFPQVEKGIHVFQHDREFYTDRGIGIHFDHHEHACPICDYNFSIPHQPEQCKFDVYVFIKSAEYVPYPAGVPFITTDGQFSPRAPPIV
ncbi:MAG TPA: hypothetical protein VN922_17480 [Bacteroidia bacterium]|nr:hypothetical protein [Bacteroidia bacterium]